jgi:hypothetical protein
MAQMLSQIERSGTATAHKSCRFCENLAAAGKGEANFSAP